MSDFDELDSLLGPLRDPATPAELASEREMVDLMVKTRYHAKGSPMFNSRRARVATFIAAGVIGFGGVAAAGGGMRSTEPDVDPVPQEIEVEEVEVEEEVTTTTAADVIEDDTDDDTSTDEVAKATQDVAEETTDDPGAPNPKTDFDLARCVPDGNHGETVSAVAREDEGFRDLEVRDAARSDCGKTERTDDTDEVEVEDAEDAVEDPEDADEDAEVTDQRRTPPGRESNNGRGDANRGNGKPGDD